MSRTWFKQLMNSLTSNTYFYFDRALYVFSASVILIGVLVSFDTLTDVLIFQGFHSNAAFFLSLTTLVTGFYFFIRSMLDMFYCDVFGFDHFRHFNKEGTEFPVPFRMKGLSRVAFSCRHPLMTSILMILGSTFMYGPIHLGRVQFVLSFMVAVLIGVHFEEKELWRHGGKGFARFVQHVPNKIMPDWSKLLLSDKELQ